MDHYSIYDLAILRSPSQPFKTRFSVKELEHLFNDEEIKAALFLASPVLLTEFEKSISNGTFRSNERLIFSLLKYAIRMHTRCTPFGFFSGCGVVNLSEGDVFNKEDVAFSIRLDMEYTASLVNAILQDINLIKYLNLYCNSSLYRIGNNYRYIQYSHDSRGRRYFVSQLESSKVLKKALNSAKYGIRFLDLVEVVKAENEDLDRKDIEEYLLMLLNEQILVTDLEPNATGRDHLSEIRNKIPRISSFSSGQPILQSIEVYDEILKNISGINLKHFYRILETAEHLNVPFDKGKLIQADLFSQFKPTYKSEYSAGYNAENQQLVNKAVKILNLLNEKRFGNSDLIDFKKRFYERYENKMIPLALVLDNESGIGYGKNVAGQRDGNGSHAGNLKNQIILDKLHMFLFDTLEKAYANNSYVVDICEEDLKDFNEDWDDLPPTMSLFYKHVGKTEGQNILLIKSLMGPSAINLMGRFALGDKEIFDLIKTIENYEKSYFGDDIIVAEIAHLPQERTGNVILRPLMRDYEIPYLAKSTVEHKSQIDIEDLYLTIKNDDLILFSKRLKKQIIPRLGNAHNYTSGDLPIYHFLCDYQSYGIRPGLSFSWGHAQKIFNFFPRIEAGKNIILSPAMWKFKSDEISNILKNANSDSQIIDNFRKWREPRKIPERTLLVSGDNELLIDFSDLLSIKLFINEVRNKNTCVLTEFIFDEENPVLYDKKGTYTNEFLQILFLKNKRDKNTPMEFGNLNTDLKKIDRVFLPGSEWLFYSIYCGESVADEILTKHLKPHIAILLKKGWIKKWFFIRYFDKHFHLRIRFEVCEKQYMGEILSVFEKVFLKLLKDRVLWRITIDTYNREIERYGKYTNDEMEELFYLDSSLILKFLSYIIEDESNRLALSISTLDIILSLYNFSLNEKLVFCESIRTAFHKEFNINKDAKIRLDRQYREKREFIDKLFTSNTSLNLEYFQKVKRSYNKEREHFDKIIQLLKDKDQSTSLNHLVASQIHMSVNRIYSSNQRMNELYIYHFMSKYYLQIVAQRKKSQLL